MESYEQTMARFEKHITDAEYHLRQAATMNAAGRHDNAAFHQRQAQVHADLALALIQR